MQGIPLRFIVLLQLISRLKWCQIERLRHQSYDIVKLNYSHSCGAEEEGMVNKTRKLEALEPHFRVEPFLVISFSAKCCLFSPWWNFRPKNGRRWSSLWICDPKKATAFFVVHFLNTLHIPFFQGRKRVLLDLYLRFRERKSSHCHSGNKELSPEFRVLRAWNGRTHPFLKTLSRCPDDRSKPWSTMARLRQKLQKKRYRSFVLVGYLARYIDDSM